MMSKQQRLNLAIILSLKEIGFTNEEILELIRNGLQTTKNTK